MSKFEDHPIKDNVVFTHDNRCVKRVVKMGFDTVYADCFMDPAEHKLYKYELKIINVVKDCWIGIATSKEHRTAAFFRDFGHIGLQCYPGKACLYTADYNRNTDLEHQLLSGDVLEMTVDYKALKAYFLLPAHGANQNPRLYETPIANERYVLALSLGEIGAKISIQHFQCDEKEDGLDTYTEQQLTLLRAENNKLQDELQLYKSENEKLNNRLRQLQPAESAAMKLLQEERKEKDVEIQALKKKVRDLSLLQMDVTKFESWTATQVLVWILSLENGRFEPYESVFDAALTKHQVQGCELKDIEGIDLYEFGMKDSFRDRKCLLRHIQSLLQQNETPNDNAVEDIE